MKTAPDILKVVVVILFLAAPVLCQTSGTGALTGTLTDANGGVVAGVQVSAINEATGERREVVSHDNGTYMVALIPPGSYRLEFSRTGFKKTVRAGLLVSVTERIMLFRGFRAGAAVCLDAWNHPDAFAFTIEQQRESECVSW